MVGHADIRVNLICVTKATKVMGRVWNVLPKLSELLVGYEMGCISAFVGQFKTTMIREVSFQKDSIFRFSFFRRGGLNHGAKCYCRIMYFTELF